MSFPQEAPPDVYICGSSSLCNEEQFLGVAFDEPHASGERCSKHSQDYSTVAPPAPAPLTHTHTHLEQLSHRLSLLISSSLPGHHLIYGSTVTPVLPFFFFFLLSPYCLCSSHICCCFRLITLFDVWRLNRPDVKLFSPTLWLMAPLRYWLNCLLTLEIQINSLSPWFVDTCEKHSSLS